MGSHAVWRVPEGESRLLYAQLLINAVTGQLGPSTNLSGKPTNQDSGDPAWDSGW